MAFKKFEKEKSEKEETMEKKEKKLGYSLTLNMSKSMHDRIKALAAERGENQNALMRRVLKNYLDRKKAD